jgi:glycosyltransferase involved in cell wall biosynthesis
MKNIAIIEDSSVNDLGGGQRITLEAINVLKKYNEYKIWVFDIGGGQSFTRLVNEKNVFLKSLCLSSKYQFAIALPFVVFEILKHLKGVDFIAYPATKKALVITFFIKILRPNVKIVFHQHIRTGFFINQLKKIARKVILPGKYSEDLGGVHIVIQNPVVVKKIKAKCSDRKKEELVIGFMGGLTELKGFKVFLEAIKYQSFKVKIAGRGELSNEIPKNENIEYLGYLDDESKLDFLKGIDIFVFPSIVPEPFPLVCFESLFNYNPVVCFDLGYPSQIVNTLNVGVVAKEMDHRSLLKAINDCRENLEKLSRNCYKVIEKYDNNNFEVELMKIFNEL